MFVAVYSIVGYSISLWVSYMYANIFVSWRFSFLLHAAVVEISVCVCVCVKLFLWTANLTLE